MLQRAHKNTKPCVQPLYNVLKGLCASWFKITRISVRGSNHLKLGRGILLQGILWQCTSIPHQSFCMLCSGFWLPGLQKTSSVHYFPSLQLHRYDVDPNGSLWRKADISFPTCVDHSFALSVFTSLETVIEFKPSSVQLWHRCHIKSSLKCSKVARGDKTCSFQTFVSVRNWS